MFTWSEGLSVRRIAKSEVYVRAPHLSKQDLIGFKPGLAVVVTNLLMSLLKSTLRSRLTDDDNDR